MNKIIILIILFCSSIFVMGQGRIQRPQSHSKKQMGQGQIQKPQSYSKKQNVETISEPDGYINGHGYVDLGLPSGVKWATYNVGATSPEEYGNYYAWGETDTKPTYTYVNSRHYPHTLVDDLKAGKGSYDTLKAKWSSKLKSDGVIDSRGNLTASYDVASANWGASWRIPTKEEFEELHSNCSFQWISFKGKEGVKVIGPNGKSIFLVTAGFMGGDSNFTKRSFAIFWISTIYRNTNWKASHFNVSGKISLSITDLGPNHGLSVRAVSE